MLGPVVLGLSLLTRRWRNKPDDLAHVTAGERPTSGQMPLHRLVPWYIVGFLVLAGLRSVDTIPHGILGPTAFVINLLTVVSMAALGLGTDLRSVMLTGIICSKTPKTIACSYNSTTTIPALTILTATMHKPRRRTLRQAQPPRPSGPCHPRRKLST